MAQSTSRRPAKRERRLAGDGRRVGHASRRAGRKPEERNDLQTRRALACGRECDTGRLWTPLTSRKGLALEKKRVGEILAGKAASKSSREFARKPFSQAADQFLEDRKPHVAERTHQLEGNLLRTLRKFLGERSLLRVGAEDIAEDQRTRRATGIPENACVPHSDLNNAPAAWVDRGEPIRASDART